MYLLAVESSTQRTSIALASLGDRGIGVPHFMPAGVQTARWLAYGVDQLLKNHGVGSSEIRAVAVTHGPGSFTGLRISVTFAKVFCYATKASLVAVDTLELLARQAPHDGTIHAVMDALRDEWFHASFGRSSMQLSRISRTEVLTSKNMVARLKADDIVTGIIPPSLMDLMPKSIRLVDGIAAVPSAAVLAQIGLERHAQEITIDPFLLVPQYYRKTYAEEKRTPPAS